MRGCVERWKELPPSGKSIWQRIQHFKAPIVEPQGKLEFVTAMHDFYEKVNDPRLTGAIFFAVCRGKVSEGLDFADNNGRAVIITGMPYPPFKDPHVVLKREYLEENRKREGQGLTGQEWYVDGHAYKCARAHTRTHATSHHITFICRRRLLLVNMLFLYLFPFSSDPIIPYSFCEWTVIHTRACACNSSFGALPRHLLSFILLMDTRCFLN